MQFLSLRSFRVHRLIRLAGVLAFGVTALCPSFLRAETDLVWDRYKSGATMYIAEFPSKPVVNRAVMRVDANRNVYSEQMTGQMDVAPAWKVKGKIDYLIRLDQTLSDPFDEVREVPYLLETEIKKLSDFYAAKGGKVVSSDITGRDDFEGRTLMVDLPAAQGSPPSSVRATVLMKGRTRIQQIVTAPKTVIERAPVAQFFHSLSLYRSEPVEPGDLKKDWVLFNLDGKGLFNVRLPAGAPPFVKETPKIEVSGAMRSVKTAIYDPIYDDTLLYSATVYDQGDSKITEEIFDLFLKKYHIETEDPSKVLLLRVSADNGYLNGKKLWSPIKPTSQHPKLFEKVIRAYYTNNYFGSSKILVVELSGSEKMLKTSFAQNILGSVTLRGDVPLTDDRATRHQIIKPRGYIELK